MSPRVFGCALPGLLALVAACGTPTDPGPEPTTFLSFASSPGDFIGGGETHRYVLTDGTWAASYAGSTEASFLQVSVVPVTTPWSWFWYLHLGAPAGQTLHVGTYESAERWPFQSAAHPGLDFSGTGRGCNTLVGRFVISELSLGPSNTISRLHATFEQHCEGSSAALTGEISIVANPWK